MQSYSCAAAGAAQQTAHKARIFKLFDVMRGRNYELFARRARRRTRAWFSNRSDAARGGNMPTMSHRKNREIFQISQIN